MHEAVIDRVDDSLEARRRRLRLAGALVELGVVAGQHGHHVHGAGPSSTCRRVTQLCSARAAGADLLVELDVAGGVDDPAPLVMGDLAVVVEAEVAVEEDRPEDLEHVGRVVPGKLAEQVVLSVVHLARVAPVLGRHLAPRVVDGEAQVVRRVVVPHRRRADGGRAGLPRAWLGVDVPERHVDLRLAQPRRARRDRARVDLVGRGARRVRSLRVVGAVAGNVGLEDVRAGDADARRRRRQVGDADRDRVHGGREGDGRVAVDPETEPEVAGVDLFGRPGRTPEIVAGAVVLGPVGRVVRRGGGKVRAHLGARLQQVHLVVADRARNEA